MTWQRRPKETHCNFAGCTETGITVGLIVIFFESSITIVVFSAYCCVADFKVNFALHPFVTQTTFVVIRYAIIFPVPTLLVLLINIDNVQGLFVAINRTDIRCTLFAFAFFVHLFGSTCSSRSQISTVKFATHP